VGCLAANLSLRLGHLGPPSLQANRRLPLMASEGSEAARRKRHVRNASPRRASAETGGSTVPRASLSRRLVVRQAWAWVARCGAIGAYGQPKKIENVAMAPKR